MNRSTPGLPVHHQLLEFTQTHVYLVGDAIQPSHPVIPFSSCPQSLPAWESSNESTLLRRVHISWPGFKMWILSSAWSHRIVSPSSRNCSSVIVLWKSRISIWLLKKNNHLYLLIISVGWDITLMISSSSLYMILFTSLCIFKIIDLKSFSSNFNMRPSRGQFLIAFSSPVYGPYRYISLHTV